MQISFIAASITVYCFQEVSASIPLIAIVRLAQDPNSVVRYYVLIKPKDDICSPYIVMTQTDIHQYRINETAKHRRGRSWSARVQDAWLPFISTKQETVLRDGPENVSVRK